MSLFSSVHRPPLSGQIVMPLSSWIRVSGMFSAAIKVKDNPDYLNMEENTVRPSPCVKCGACCAFFLVAFPACEIDKAMGGIVPRHMTQSFPTAKRSMKGTKGHHPRCIALEGDVGVKVKCSIYENRSSVCRDFKFSWENGDGNFLCDRARSAFGLQPFLQY